MVMAMTKKVSVMTLTYNHAQFIAQAMESALEQETTFDYEMIVGDDCSTDGTQKILVDLQAAHPDKMRVLFSDRNAGLHANITRTLAECQGEYLAVLEGDDYWTSKAKLQTQVELLDRHPDWALCFHRAVILDQESGAEHDFGPRTRAESYGVEDILTADFIPTCSVVMRRELLKFKPAWLDELPVADWPSWIVYASHGKLGYLDETWGVYRRHAAGIWSGMAPPERMRVIAHMYTRVNEYLEFKHERLIKSLMERIEDAQRLIKLHEEIPLLHAKIAELGAQAAEREQLHARIQDLATLAGERPGLYERIQALSDDCARHVVEIQELENTCARLRGFEKECAALRSEVEDLRNARADLARQIQGFQRERAGLNDRSGQLDEEPNVASRGNGHADPVLPTAMDDYRRVVERTRALVCAVVPPGEIVAVVSKGDAALLDLGGRRSWHFPQAPDGSYAGRYPANAAEAIDRLEALRRNGANFLVIPSTAFWWLDHYLDFKRYLDSHGEVVGHQPEVCTVFALRPRGPLA